ncbi:MAG: hypothetical protein FWG42_08500 [Clostridiales bacterium]|nr:hypothetical protein [Clostridiales bacterium]
MNSIAKHSLKFTVNFFTSLAGFIIIGFIATVLAKDFVLPLFSTPLIILAPLSVALLKGVMLIEETVR